MLEDQQVSCIFCSIVQKDEPASIVYEDAQILAFLDIAPINPGHTLVIPKVHYESLSEVPDSVVARMMTVAKKIATAIRLSGVCCEGINLLLADGEAAFQDVFHCHLHVVPRFKGDSFRIDGCYSNHPERLELDRVALEIRSNMESV
jgi:histidine triad (HIT) family protein